MTIKEIENLSGLTRANIYFYEEKGLLHPNRNPNGYRNYSNEDLESLQKIRLLRTLHISVEDINAIILGKRQLSDVLASHIRDLRMNENDLHHCREICSQIHDDQADYSSLDWQQYMDLVDTFHFKSTELQDDSLLKVTAPWKRFFARGVDLSIYGLIIDIFLSLVLHINTHTFSIGKTLFLWFAQIVLILFIEPVMITLTRTTPGKALFGLYVTSTDSSHIPYRKALHRTWLVVLKGYGLFLPIYSLLRLYSSYKTCRNIETLEWETDSSLKLNHKATAILVFKYLLMDTAIAICSFLIWQAGALPIHRGDLTIAEFCENYNQLQQYFEIDRPVNIPDSFAYIHESSPTILNEDVSWQDVPGVYQDYSSSYGDLPELHFKNVDNNLSEISFSQSYKNEDVMLAPYGDLMALTAISYICAQNDYYLLPITPEEIYETISNKANSYSDFTYNIAGVIVECKIHYSGYTTAENGNILVPQYGQTPTFDIEFSITNIRY